MPAMSTGPTRADRRRLSWAVVILTLATITSSSLSALSLYHVLALQAEVEGLRTEVSRRREEQQSAPGESVSGPQAHQQDNRNKAESLRQTSSVVPPELGFDVSGRQPEPPSLKKRSLESFQPCLQMIADRKREVFQKEFALETHTGVPWQTGLKRGEALEEDHDTIVVKEEGFFFIYSQVEHCDPPVTEVYYKDSTFAMGHIVIRMKKNVVGDESQHVVLFRCIQSMNLKFPYNTCYTGGIVKLEVGDRVELLIPRSTANISLDGDSTYLGAIKLD
ncbi:tumor necrosis factor ligand superfamily member 13B isoform X1 [Pygocentrus nattereri]|uniref:THD domain-containing protein n=1 Tax=Pygocentrus nattereri TaxID=42514 RepID=A0A3B4DJH1_PYGNA|nr:tumor necrosis factor ligand superfamily member 13B isoform X1 [Pygocentrus nattereri]XP_017560177.1 tumor necrosis factor ligand superfamily member 13B isoform X1 [Pygocentrus nattereri]